MNELIKALNELLPTVDFEKEKSLVSEGILDSLSLVSIMLMINEVYHVDIPVEEMSPENFDSVESMYALIEKIKASSSEMH